MPVITDLQASFGGGELSPFLYSRVDLGKFHVGARTMLNFFVHPHGGVSNRAGTRFIGAVDDSTQRHRLIPFKFRNAPAGQTYALVFGNKTMQVVMMNQSTGVPGFVLNNDNVTIFTLATPYTTADLPLLKYVQSADKMTLTHPNYAVRQLTRSAHNAWQLTPITFAPSTPPPTGLAAGSSGSSVNLVVTAINDNTGEESLPSDSTGSSGATDTWTWNPVIGCSNYNVYKKSGSLYGFVAQVQSTTWTDNNIAGDIGNTPPGSRTPFGTGIFTGLVVEAGGSGYASPTGILIDGITHVTTVTLGTVGGVIVSATPATTGQSISAGAFVQITDGAGTGAALQPNFSAIDPDSGLYTLLSVTVGVGGSGYSDHPVIGFTDGGTGGGGPIFTASVSGGVITAVALGGSTYQTGVPSFFNFVIVDSAGVGAVILPNITADGGNLNPCCSSYYQQRQAFGNTLQTPQTLWMTVVGAFGNMNVSTPTKDSDAITRALTGRQVDEIRHLVPIGTNMLVMTSGAEWRCWPGPTSNALTPAACYTLVQSNYGSSHVPPLVVGNDVLFVQERGSRVRTLKFDLIQDQYQSQDMSVFAQHLLYDVGGQHSILEWAFAEEPFRIVWAVRDDGVLLGFTFMREQEVYAWHRHITAGAVESVCSIPETENGVLIDALYLIVNRTVSGQTVRYIERMASRVFADISQAWFLDCALQYYNGGATTSTVTGLTHLIGQTVYALADGSVVGPLTVDDAGSVTLDGSYARVTVGLTYSAQLETLDLELRSGLPTMQGMMKKIPQVRLKVKDTRGLKVGIAQEVRSTGAETAPALVEVKQRDLNVTLGTAMAPYNGIEKVVIPEEWATGGRIFCQQDYPLPCSILDLIPDMVVGS